MLTLPLSAFAGKVDLEKARQVAQNWLQNYAGDKRLVGSKTYRILGHEPILVNNQTVGYNFILSPRGHIIVPSRDELPVVKLYSFTSTLRMAQGGEEAKWIRDELFGVEEAIDSHAAEMAAVNHAQTHNGRLWARFGKDSTTFAQESAALPVQQAEALTLGPLLSTTWDQGDPYNLNTPQWNTGEKTLTGCVATAAAQIMKFWNYPTTGQGSHSYTWNNGVADQTLSANFAASTYDWANMTNSYGAGSTTAQKQAVAKLMSDVGIAFEMDYGIGSAGGSAASTMYGTTVYPTYFKYKNTIQAVYRTSYASDSAWMQVFKNEVQNGRPSQFRLRDPSAGGHSVVVDGYQDSPSEQIHLNMGWAGSYDGWYVSNNIVTGGYSWSDVDYQGAVIGIEPETITSVTLPEALDNPAWTVTTGGEANWSGQSVVNHDGADAAQSGDIADSQSSWMQTTVTGPLLLSFWWKVSSESGYDYLRFYVDDVQQGSAISGSVDWTQVTGLAVGAGTHTLKWQYSKDSSVSTGSDAGWVDQVVLMSGNLLTVNLLGNGEGNVTPNTGTLTWNGNTGTAGYPTGTVVTLTAAADPGSTFAGWGGACSGTAPTCQVTMDAAKDVTATFSMPHLTVNLLGAGAGSVTPNTGTLTWDGKTGTAGYASGTVVTLTAAAGPGSAFAGWGGACSGTAPTCQVTMNADRTVTATFNGRRIMLLDNSLNELQGAMDQIGYSYTKLDAAGFTAATLSNYDVIMTAWQLPAAIAQALVDRKAAIASWTTAGGRIFTSSALDTAASGVNDWSWVPLSVTPAYVGHLNDVTVVATSHPLMTTPHPLDSAAMSNWGNSYHNVWTSYDPAYELIAKNGSNQAIILAASYGSGMIVVSGSDPEYHTLYGPNAGRYYLENLLTWGGYNTSGRISGTVTDAVSGTPVSGATVTATGPSTASAVTGADGGYSINYLTPGTYTLTGVKSGYQNGTKSGVVVSSGLTTTANFTMTASNRTLSVVVSGNGSVNSSPTGIACTTGNSGVCSYQYPSGQSLSLTPTASSDSMFMVWTGDCTSVIGEICNVTLHTDKSVTANFIILPPVFTGSSYYGSLQSAYNSAAPSCTIKAKAVELPAGNLTLDLGKTVLLEGGYNSSYGSNSGGYTTMDGVLTMEDGSLTVENLIIK